MRRRQFISILCALGAAPYARSVESSQRGPLFWLAKRGKARVFLLGFSDAKANERSWLTPSIQRAFDESSTLWLETAPPARDVESMKKAAQLMQELGRDPEGTFFDALEPSIRSRAIAYVEELGIDKTSIKSLRPWRAYYTINSAHWSRRKLPFQLENVDDVLRKLAGDENKAIQYEMPTGEHFIRFMAAMSDKAQSQYIEWLLDYIDDQKAGRNDAVFDWEIGKPMSRPLDRMRTKMPALYDVMQVRRNEWWAKTIDTLLSGAGTAFVAVGQLHVLGSDGIPAQLQRLRIVNSSQFTENPSLTN